MSKWGIQHVKIELENEQGERLVIDQEPGGRVTCHEPGGRTPGGAKTPAPKPASSKAEPAKPAEEPTKAGARTAPRRAAKPETATKAAKPKSEGRKPGRRRASSLEWKPVKDTGYHGFAAKSEGGAYKLLKARNSQWALFFERPPEKTAPLGCFKEDAPGRVKAQELHDSGTYRVESDPITEYRIINVCPVDPAEAAAPSPEAASEAANPEVIAPNADTDAEMLASLKKALEDA